MLIENKESFSVSLTVSLNSLHERNLIRRKGKYLNLTEEGRNNAKEIIDEIKEEYGEINWNIINSFYYKLGE